MTVTFHLPPEIEQRLRAQTPDLESQLKEASAVELFRRGKISHYELSQILDLDRFATDAFLQRNKIYEGADDGRP
jgi:predicted HTH domain antitoxin